MALATWPDGVVKSASVGSGGTVGAHVVLCAGPLGSQGRPQGCGRTFRVDRVPVDPAAVAMLVCPQCAPGAGAHPSGRMAEAQRGGGPK
ncbi:MAG: hypothetical protein ACRDI2_17395 [Chloroflexota bacterium]